MQFASLIIEPPLGLANPARPPGKRRQAADDRSAGEAKTPTLRVLVVDDEFFVALDATDHLESDGHEVVGTAVTADEAVEKAGALQPDLVLMDIRLLGERDGIEAALEIRQRFGIRCLFVSAYSDPETRARASQAEPIGFLAKPFTRGGLLAAIRTHFRAG